jgi:hypothetical protein
MSNGIIGLPAVAEARAGVEAADEEARASGATCKQHGQAKTHEQLLPLSDFCSTVVSQALLELLACSELGGRLLLT